MINLKLNKKQISRLKSFITNELEREDLHTTHYNSLKEIKNCIVETQKVTEENSNLTKLELMSVVRGLEKKKEELQTALKKKEDTKLTLFEVYQELGKIKGNVSCVQKENLLKLCKNSLVGPAKKDGGVRSQKTRVWDIRKLRDRLNGLPRRHKPKVKSKNN